MKKWVWLILILGLASRAPADSYWESEYAAALLAFHDGDDDSALRHTEQLVAADSKNNEVLQLHALLLRRADRWEEAGHTFEKLQQGYSEQGVYSFEAAACWIHLGQYEAARTDLQVAQKLAYQPTATQLMAAVIDFQTGKISSAEKVFRETAKSDSGALRGVALVYLGKIARQRGREQDAQHLWGQAEGALLLASPGEDDFELQHLMDHLQADTKAKPWSASIGVYGGYDSNSLLVPTFYLPTYAAAGPVGLVAYHLAAVAPVTPEWTLLGSYQGGLDINANSLAASADFLTQLFGFSLTHNGALSWGLKAEGEYALRNGVDGTPGFQSESLALALAPFVRWALDRRTFAEVELVAMPQEFFDDPSLPGNLRKSGYETRLRGTIGPNRSKRFWPPRLEASVFYQHTLGDEYEAVGVDLWATIAWAITQHLTLEPRLGGGVARYGAREDGPRNDGYWHLGADLVYAIATDWDLRLSAAEHYNASNVPTLYQYTRDTFFFGVEVTL